MTELAQQLRDALNKLAKWRTHLAGWQLGTRLKTDPECEAVRDHREQSLLMRAELNALITFLITKKIMTREEWMTVLTTEAIVADEELEKHWPGVTTHQDGLHIDLKKVMEAGWMKNWKP